MGRGETLAHLGDAHRSAGDLDAARAAWLRALAVLEELGHPDADEVRAKLDLLGQAAGPGAAVPVTTRSWRAG